MRVNPPVGKSDLLNMHSYSIFMVISYYINQNTVISVFHTNKKTNKNSPLNK